MKPRASVIFAALTCAAALACAAPLAAQDAPRGPTLLRVAASSGGVVLSLDSSSIAHTGDSTFVVDAVYQLPADTAAHVAADRQVESQEMDCGRARVRGRSTALYAGGELVPISTSPGDPAQPARWQPVGDDELPIFQAICGYLLASFATSLPVTQELWGVDRQPELVNRMEAVRQVFQEYPRDLRQAGIGGVVQVRFLVTAEGRVDPATLSPHWATRPGLAAAALRAVPRMRFHPAQKDGAPVAVWVTLPLCFGTACGGPQEPIGPQRGPTRSPLSGSRP